MAQKIQTFNEGSLNPAQKAAAKAPNGPLLIVAGAGTGKTRTLTSRILYLIQSGVAPERICAITFTNKAAKEMERRIAKSGPFIGTFHALGSRILRRESSLTGRGPNFTIFDDHDSFGLVKKAVKAALPGISAKTSGKASDLTPAKKKENPAFFARKISEAKNLPDFPAEEEAKKLALGETMPIRKVFDSYEAALRENNAFDFDDLIEKTVALFKSRPEILKKYQGMFDAVLVDEYQDINPKQHELIALLAGGHRNLSVVGDDEQTIYSWRYADVRTFLGFEKEWKGASVHFLEENYRSTETIIRAAAAVVKNNRFRAPKNLFTRNPAGDPITLFEAWGENEEAEWIAEQIEMLKRKSSAEEIGVLYRTNAQSRAIEQALIRRNIPYRIFGGLKFYERREVKDAVAALRYIANNKDTPAKERLEKELSKRKFAEFKAKIPEVKTLSPLDALKLFIEAFDYMEYLERNFLNPEEREDNIGELVAFAGEFKTLPEFLERLSLLQATDEIKDRSSEGKEVALMTIHLAKGLEFDAVFIAGVAEGILPHGRSLDTEAEVEEERRLMYVAMTRARKKLFISFYGMPSRFIAEIPEDCIAIGSAQEEENIYGEDEDGERVVSLD